MITEISNVVPMESVLSLVGAMTGAIIAYYFRNKVNMTAQFIIVAIVYGFFVLVWNAPKVLFIVFYALALGSAFYEKRRKTK